MIDENIDDEIAKLEEEIKNMGDTKSDGYGHPTAAQKDSILRFFRELIKEKDSRKIANLSQEELKLVRYYLDLSHYADAEGLDLVAEYITGLAEVSLATSMAKKGFLVQSAITQIKKEQKLKEPSPQVKKWFGAKKEEGT